MSSNFITMYNYKISREIYLVFKYVLIRYNHTYVPIYVQLIEKILNILPSI